MLDPTRMVEKERWLLINRSINTTSTIIAADLLWDEQVTVVAQTIRCFVFLIFLSCLTMVFLFFGLLRWRSPVILVHPTHFSCILVCDGLSFLMNKFLYNRC